MQTVLEFCLPHCDNKQPLHFSALKQWPVSVKGWLRALALCHWQGTSLKEPPTPHSTAAEVG